MRRKLTAILSALALGALGALTLSGCAEPTGQGRGVYLLMDTSGTYTKELKKAEQIITAILAQLEPGEVSVDGLRAVAGELDPVPVREAESLRGVRVNPRRIGVHDLR